MPKKCVEINKMNVESTIQLLVAVFLTQLESFIPKSVEGKNIPSLSFEIDPTETYFFLKNKEKSTIFIDYLTSRVLSLSKEPTTTLPSFHL